MSNKIEFSPLIIGMMRMGEWGAKMSTAELEKFVDECLDLGLKDFDHADIYGHYTEEANFGTVIKKRPDLKQKIQVTSKCGIKLLSENRPSHYVKSYDSTKKHILWSTENSLKELHLDKIDLLLIHRPDFLMDPHEIAEAIEQLKKEGKIIHFGVSNFTPAQFELLNSFTPLVTNQVEASIIHTAPFEDGTITQCQQLGITPTIWSPFGGGAIFGLSSKMDILRIREVANKIREKHNAGLDQILLAWLNKHPAGLVSITGSTKIERIKDALNALEISLSHQEWYQLWEAAKGEEVA